jgi:hypothetical protein
LWANVVNIEITLERSRKVTDIELPKNLRNSLAAVTKSKNSSVTQTPRCGGTPNEEDTKICCVFYGLDCVLVSAGFILDSCYELRE